MLEAQVMPYPMYYPSHLLALNMPMSLVLYVKKKDCMLTKCFGNFRASNNVNLSKYVGVLCLPFPRVWMGIGYMVGFFKEKNERSRDLQYKTI